MAAGQAGCARLHRDEPGSWFDSGVDLFGPKSLGVIEAPLSKIPLRSDPARTDSNHTASSLL